MLDCLQFQIDIIQFQLHNLSKSKGYDDHARVQHLREENVLLLQYRTRVARALLVCGERYVTK